MAASAAPSREEVVLLARLHGLEVPAEYVDDLVEAYGHVQAMIARLPAPRLRADEPAHVFVAGRFEPGGG